MRSTASRFLRGRPQKIHKNLKKALTNSKACDKIIHAIAGVAHLVERHLAKVEVASSSLFTRSMKNSVFVVRQIRSFSMISVPFGTDDIFSI